MIGLGIVGEEADRIYGRFLDEREVIIRDALGLEFRQTLQVRIRRPGWMPEALFRWLWRTAITIDTPITAKPRGWSRPTVHNPPLPPMLDEYDPDPLIARAEDGDR